MIIPMKKFGSLLISRPAGREAFLAASAYFAFPPPPEPIELDFEGVNVLAPSWADEFLSPLFNQIGDRLTLLPSDNLSVQATIKILQEANKWLFKFKIG